jgi:hypothetical protein
MSARADPRGGRSAMTVPTATANYPKEPSFPPIRGEYSWWLFSAFLGLGAFDKVGQPRYT